MKKELTITFLLDSEWINEETGEKFVMDEQELQLYALEQARDASRIVEGFERAEFGGELLLSKDGEAPESVKKTPLYKRILREMQMNS